MVKVIAFKANGKDNRYLADGIDCVDWSDDYGDVTNLGEALLIFGEGLTEPNQSNVENFYKFIASLPMSNDVRFIKDNYEPVTIEITAEQLAENKERNEW